jgi:hypothetical protein
MIVKRFSFRRDKESGEAHMKNTWAGSPWLAVLLLAFACSPHAQTAPKNVAANLGGTDWQLVKFRAVTTRR